MRGGLAGAAVVMSEGCEEVELPVGRAVVVPVGCGAVRVRSWCGGELCELLGAVENEQELNYRVPPKRQHDSKSRHTATRLRRPCNGDERRCGRMMRVGWSAEFEAGGMMRRSGFCWRVRLGCDCDEWGDGAGAGSSGAGGTGTAAAEAAAQRRHRQR